MVDQLVEIVDLDVACVRLGGLGDFSLPGGSS